MTTPPGGGGGRGDGRARRRGPGGVWAGAWPRQAVLAAFGEVITGTLDGARDGCLLVNTALEVSPHDGEIAAVVAKALEEMEAFFRTMVRRGQAAGESSPGRGATETAHGRPARLAEPTGASLPSPRAPPEPTTGTAIVETNTSRAAKLARTPIVGCRS